jgi:hypothetical protein
VKTDPAPPPSTAPPPPETYRDHELAAAVALAAKSCESLAAEVIEVIEDVHRVEVSIKHLREDHLLRFKSLDDGISGLHHKLDDVLGQMNQVLQGFSAARSQAKGFMADVEAKLKAAEERQDRADMGIAGLSGGLEALKLKVTAHIGESTNGTHR